MKHLVVLILLSTIMISCSKEELCRDRISIPCEQVTRASSWIEAYFGDTPFCVYVSDESPYRLRYGSYITGSTNSNELDFDSINGRLAGFRFEGDNTYKSPTLKLSSPVFDIDMTDEEILDSLATVFEYPLDGAPYEPRSDNFLLSISYKCDDIPSNFATKNGVVRLNNQDDKYIRIKKFKKFPIKDSLLYTIHFDVDVNLYSNSTEEFHFVGELHTEFKIAQ